MEKIDNLNSFLSLGYFLDYKNPDISFDLSNIPQLKKELSKLSEEELLIECKKRWYQTFEQLYEKGEHLVPLSGGLDSRAILATLLEFVEADKISTYTFGTPGTYDYEIGKLIADKTGTRHSQFSFNDYVFSTEKEIEVSKRIDHQTFLFHHAPLEELDKLYKDYFVWSGYILDVIAGSYLPKELFDNIDNVKLNTFIKDSFNKSITLTTPDAKVFFNYDAPEKILAAEILSFNEQINLINRQLKNTAPHILYKDFTYKIPVLNQNLFSFFFSLDNSYRRDESFYIKFITKEFPDLFSLPVKSRNGLPFNSSKIKVLYRKVKNKVFTYGKKIRPSIIHPHTNYMDFNEGIRMRKDLNKVIYENINDLKIRKLVDWVDIDKIYNDHMNRKVNHADALIVLASLEIHLKAGKKL